MVWCHIFAVPAYSWHFDTWVYILSFMAIMEQPKAHGIPSKGFFSTSFCAQLAFTNYIIYAEQITNEGGQQDKNDNKELCRTSTDKQEDKEDFSKSNDKNKDNKETPKSINNDEYLDDQGSEIDADHGDISCQ